MRVICVRIFCKADLLNVKSPAQSMPKRKECGVSFSGTCTVGLKRIFTVLETVGNPTFTAAEAAQRTYGEGRAVHFISALKP